MSTVSELEPVNIPIVGSAPNGLSEFDRMFKFEEVPWTVEVSQADETAKVNEAVNSEVISTLERVPVSKGFSDIDELSEADTSAGVDGSVVEKEISDVDRLRRIDKLSDPN